jgi:hypothetical protein
MNKQELGASLPSDTLKHKRSLTAFRKPGSEVAALAIAQIFCFLALTRLEPHFFIIHLYQLIPSIAILILLGYGQAHWAYTVGPLVSIVWLGLAYMADLLGSAAERLRTFGSNNLDDNFVALLALLTGVVAVLMTVLCCIHWVKEYSGHERGWRPFLVSLGIVLAYYGILLHWFWDMIPDS